MMLSNLAITSVTSITWSFYHAATVAIIVVVTTSHSREDIPAGSQTQSNRATAAAHLGIHYYFVGCVRIVVDVWLFGSFYLLPLLYGV